MTKQRTRRIFVIFTQVYEEKFMKNQEQKLTYMIYIISHYLTHNILYVSYFWQIYFFM